MYFMIRQPQRPWEQLRMFFFIGLSCKNGSCQFIYTTNYLAEIKVHHEGPDPGSQTAAPQSHLPVGILTQRSPGAAIGSAAPPWCSCGSWAASAQLAADTTQGAGKECAFIIPRQTMEQEQFCLMGFLQYSSLWLEARTGESAVCVLKVWDS